MRIPVALCISVALMACDNGPDTGARNQPIDYVCENDGPCTGVGCNQGDPKSEALDGCMEGAYRIVPSNAIRDGADDIVGYVDLWFSPSCCAMWAETSALGSYSDPDQIAAFVFYGDSNTPQPDTPGRAQPLVNGLTNVWWSAMTAAAPDAVACGWFWVNGQRYGMCSNGVDINHAPICTGATANPASMVADEEDEMFGRVPIAIEGVYDPDGDPFVIRTDRIDQNQYTQGRRGGAGQTCPDGFSVPDGQGNLLPEVNLERSGLYPPCRIYQITFRAFDQRGGVTSDTLFCDPPGVVETHVMHNPSVTQCLDAGPDWVESWLCECDYCTWPDCPSYCPPRRRVPQP